MLYYIYINFVIKELKQMNKSIRKLDNSLIQKRRNKTIRKRAILLLVFMICIFSVLCFKLPYLNVTSINVVNNRIVSQDEIIKLSGIQKGNNIFYLNTTSEIEGISKNPYILSAKVERKLPSGVTITVVEREAMYFNTKDKKYFVIDKNGIVLEIKEDIKNMNLIKLDGFDYSKAELGKQLESDDKRRLEVIIELGKYIKPDNILSKFTSIDISDPNALNVYFGNICIKLGNCDNIDKKLNTAVNILQRDEVKDGKGYIDVSFQGNPVYHIEK